MSFPKSYYEELTNSYCTKIGQDFRGILKYNFNNFGFINNIDYSVDEKNALCFFGSAITSAIGIPWEQSFGYRLSQFLGPIYKSYNFSQGCVFVDNKEIFNTVKQVYLNKQFKPYAYIIQFIDLDRVFNPKKETGTLSIDAKKNVESFLFLFNELEKLLENEKWIFFGCDTQDYDLPIAIKNHKNCLIWNPPLFDKMLLNVPGEKWHRMIALGLNKKFQELYKTK